ncbi:thioredoxin domain-containing protein [Rhodohalobacter sp. 8-1]|uniref:thioredoxin domain-containing protein n=1 Tax=Rhodohalobacter sp. 8-1 TaxID=3131972 RepID=UPI0030EBE467
MNSLKNAKSPYLLQHAENPVNWYPWCDEAFEKAKTEDKPVFLSIGYATCHWCHVMAHESFEDKQVAELMNDTFINIKVDREERPDIDNTYMTVCQMLTGRGGWPLTIIMTPDKEPFFAGTYLPKNSRGQQLGMTDLIPQIQKIWTEDRQRIRQSVESIRDGFSKTLSLGTSTESLPDNIIDDAQQALQRQFDDEHGGFGSEPKFPSPHNLLFLLHHAEATGNQTSREMALHTLRQMRQGGIWDHIGGGFHRYSTDEKWLLPHFEKMLYDQAMLMLAYTEGWRVSSDPVFKDTCYRIFDYLKAIKLSPEGAFYSAEDADSEGEEGKFYVWERDEIFELLTADQADLFCEVYNIKEKGNFRDEATGEFTGKNIPYLSRSLFDLAADKDSDPDELGNTLDEIRDKLNDIRKKRPRPLLDDKILTDWNGLMMAALATAGAIFSDSAFTDAAVEIESFISSEMVTSDGRLLHRYRVGGAGIDAMADDYTALIWGLIELYETTHDPTYLKKAIDFQKQFNERFRDEEHGGFYLTSSDSETPMGRQKEIYDGALPSSNSVAALNGFRLSRLTGNPDYEETSERILTSFSEVIADNPSAYTFALITKLTALYDPVEIAVTGSQEDSETQEILDYLSRRNRFKHSVLLKSHQTKEALNTISPFTESFPMENKAMVYVCRNFTCDAPISSLNKLKKAVEEN